MRPLEIWREKRNVDLLSQRAAFYVRIWLRGRFAIPLPDARRYGQLLPHAIRLEQERLGSSGLPRTLTPEVVERIVSSAADSAEVAVCVPDYDADLDTAADSESSCGPEATRVDDGVVPASRAGVPRCGTGQQSWFPSDDGPNSCVTF